MAFWMATAFEDLVDLLKIGLLARESKFTANVKQRLFQRFELWQEMLEHSFLAAAQRRKEKRAARDAV